MTELGRHVDPAHFAKLITPELVLALKSPQQGAATTVYVATGKEWEGKGGIYFEDCSISSPKGENDTSQLSTYLPYIYDEESSKRLWEISLKLVGEN